MAETHELVWLRIAPNWDGREDFAVRAIPAGLTQRARRVRIGKLMVEHGADRRTVEHGLNMLGRMEISAAESYDRHRVLAWVLPAGTARARIIHPFFPGRAPLEVNLSSFTVDGESDGSGQVTVGVHDPVPDPYGDPENPSFAWEQSDARRWLDWAGLEPLDPGPILLNTTFAVRTQVASLQVR